MTVTWGWNDLWPHLRSMPAPVQKQLARQLDLEAWLMTRSPRVQYEVIEHAPEKVVHVLIKKGVLHHDVLAKLMARDEKAIILKVPRGRRGRRT